MLKRIVQACFLIIGITLGIFLIPELLILIRLEDIPLINNPYVSAILGAIIFYLITFWAVDHVVNFIKWTEESIVKVPITDIIFGSLGLIFGLVVAFLIGYALNTIEFPIFNTVAPIVLTLLFGYLGFQIGFKKRDELLTLFTSKKKKVNEDEVEIEANKLKILDTAFCCQRGLLIKCLSSLIGLLPGKQFLPRVQ